MDHEVQAALKEMERRRARFQLTQHQRPKTSASTCHGSRCVSRVAERDHGAMEPSFSPQVGLAYRNTYEQGQEEVVTWQESRRRRAVQKASSCISLTPRERATTIQSRERVSPTGYFGLLEVQLSSQRSVSSTLEPLRLGCRCRESCCLLESAAFQIDVGPSCAVVSQVVSFVRSLLSLLFLLGCRPLSWPVILVPSPLPVRRISLDSSWR